MVKFGTGGWRAIIGEEFTKENIQKLTLAMCLKMKAEHKDTKSVVIGYDRRFLSKQPVIIRRSTMVSRCLHMAEGMQMKSRQRTLKNGCWKQKNCIHHVMKRMGRCRRQVIQNW